MAVGQTYNVVVRRIDDILQEQGAASVDFIKMDIEFGAASITRRGKHTLKTYRPAILPRDFQRLK